MTPELLTEAASFVYISILEFWMVLLVNMSKSVHKTLFYLKLMDELGRFLLITCLFLFWIIYTKDKVCCLLFFTLLFSLCPVRICPINIIVFRVHRLFSELFLDNICLFKILFVPLIRIITNMIDSVIVKVIYHKCYKT